MGAFYNQTKKNHEPETKKMKEDGYLRSETERNRLTPVRRRPGKIQTIGKGEIQPEIDVTDEEKNLRKRRWADFRKKSCELCDNFVYFLV